MSDKFEVAQGANGADVGIFATFAAICAEGRPALRVSVA
jgi:hypothetical protein